jgi:SAM-dependent methyltransferase
MSTQDETRKRIEAAVQHCYSTWGTTYYKDYYQSGAPYPPVHVELLRGLVLESGARTVLDAGCGPASFLRHLTGDGLELFGFDLTAEMVEEARRVFGEKGLEPGRVWQGSVLDAEAYRAPAGSTYPQQYDAAVCVGVMPHVAAEHDAVVFANMRQALRPGGLAVIEARNQLFSLFTLNRPSYEFISNDLIRAEERRASAGAERPALDAALEKMQAQFRMDLPPIRRGKAGEPGYDEVVSRTHNPLAMRPQFEAAGFRDVRVLFYHYHVVPPMFAAQLPEYFIRESVAMEDPADWRGHFMASAFVLAGRKA